MHKQFPVIVASLALLSGSALAQSTVKPADITPVETVTVVAPFLLGAKDIRENPHQHVLAVSLLGAASYSDLDLSKPADAEKLKARITETATKLCKQIEARYPSQYFVPVTDQDCVKSAITPAFETADIIIAAWRRV